MESDIKVGDILVEDVYPTNLALNGKFLKREIVVKAYLPQSKCFTFVFGNEIECVMSAEQKKAYEFAAACLKTIELYEREFTTIITKITRQYLKDVLGIKIT